jgi:gas vesicle protein
MRKLIAFIAGAALGSLVGTTLALLMAPSTGADLRTKAQNRYQEIRSEIIDASAARRAELEGQLQALRSPRKPASL